MGIGKENTFLNFGSNPLGGEGENGRCPLFKPFADTKALQATWKEYKIK